MTSIITRLSLIRPWVLSNTSVSVSGAYLVSLSISCSIRFASILAKEVGWAFIGLRRLTEKNMNGGRPWKCMQNTMNHHILSIFTRLSSVGEFEGNTPLGTRPRNKLSQNTQGTKPEGQTCTQNSRKYCLDDGALEANLCEEEPWEMNAWGKSLVNNYSRLRDKTFRWNCGARVWWDQPFRTNARRRTIRLQ